VDDVTGAQTSAEPGELATERLLLCPMTAEHVAAVTSGRRLPHWAPGYPSEGDRRIAELLERQGVPAGPDQVFGHRLVVERETGQVVGGIGLKGAPTDGRVELGYGIVESRRGRGYATEAAQAMVSMALELPGVTEVVAGADPANVASVRVLERAGFILESQDGNEFRYVVPSPSAGQR
jgi:ribosomal-protein-alanine N-acetyltransferase